MTLNKIEITKEKVDARKIKETSINFRNVKKPSDKFNPTHLSLLGVGDINVGLPKF